MLELPESRTIAEQAREALTGRTIRSVQANASPHGFAFYFGDPQDYARRLCGRTIESAHSYGGLVELSASEMRLLMGDGTNIRYLAPGEKLPQKHQLLVEFDDGAHLCCTIQTYGGIWAFADGENDNFYYLVAKEKPEPLADAFTWTYFERMMAGIKPTLSAKALLATEQRIPGLGNGVLQDILFEARIHPKSKISTLSEEEKHRLYEQTRRVLFEMTVKGGRDTERDLFGCPGGYVTRLSKKTLEKPCPVCGGVLVRQAYLGGNVYLCPICQPLKK
ncbi:DNA-formamidopyrimidine glycosylase family protein [Candidatus Soleaferrea massiliensis]|uniref:DNA-formamidopyrimidine glycosylase family protein n=1 Tax=Candidatus Soleaferrea massiliensis TaxID=1470354 RepID=UPI00058FF009|nr:DNA-formamidopyrimidine glycosylase family protein [Candidatus Soleaferrea massiliensis]